MIRMPHNFPDIKLLAGEADYETMQYQACFRPFDETVCNFLMHLSKKLLGHANAQQFPDVVTFAFFCRRANLVKLSRLYEQYRLHALGRGLSFHIAPSNVPINFAYSLLAGLLAGNSCIVRVSSKSFPQVDLLMSVMTELFAQSEFSLIKSRVAIVQYEHSVEINSFFSGICDFRVIWGGDHSIQNIRISQLSAHAFDITFSDRYSICMINASAYLALNDKTQLAEHFYNDTYLFDQNACSSPRLVYWLGNSTIVDQAQHEFWQVLHRVLLAKDYVVSALTAVNKYVACCRAAIELEQTEIDDSQQNLINRIALKTLSADWMNYSCAGGCYLEYCSETMDQLGVALAKKVQTLSYVGLTGKDLHEFVRARGYKGVDRIVPCGQAANFQLSRDGYDLIRQMSREVCVL